MPKFKGSTTVFRLTVSTDSQRSKITIPRMLHSQLGNDIKQIKGTFILREKEMILIEETKTVSLKHLLSKWWDTHIIERTDLDNLDWSELLSAIGITVKPHKKKLFLISGYDNTTYDTGTWWVSFSIS